MEGSMVTKILKWGNSLGLRIPKSFAREAGIQDGSAVDISLDGDRIVIRPANPVRYQISDLVSEIREDNIHDEIPTGDSKGREVW
jgi:antitoxin MazE